MQTTPPPDRPPSAPQIAIVGAGLAGAACARTLAAGGAQVTLFDKSRGIGGRLSTRRTVWTDAFGVEQPVQFDHGAVHFGAHSLAFRALVEQGLGEGWIARWSPGHGSDHFVAVPGMPALCHALIGALDVHCGAPVTALHRVRGGWQIEREGGLWPQRFDQVVLALPPAQAAPLLRPHATRWSEAAAQVPMQACWTLMAVTDEPPGPACDLLEPGHGPLDRIVRNDRKPGRPSLRGHAVWVAQASAAWSASHVDDTAAAVSEALRDALRAVVNPGGSLRWCHSTVHRWLYARPARTPLGTPGCWWDAAKGLGVCGDFLVGPQVEAAFLSGLDMAQAMRSAPATRRTATPGAARFARL
jgi:predicted NAD/FAD-dependent oxidoreductase